MRYPNWYLVYKIDMKINNVLGSIPENPKDLEYVKRYYQRTLGVDEEKAKEMMDVDEATHAEETVTQKCVFRRNSRGEPYFTYGQIVGWLEEAVRAANLSRKIRNIPYTFVTDPRRIVPKKYKMGEDVIRPVRSFVAGQYITALVINEHMEFCELEFNLLTTNKDFDKYAEQVFEIGRRIIGFGPARAHGYGEIEKLEWERIQ